MPSFRATCSHDHDCGEADCGVSYSLYKHIDLAHVTCLNESEPEGCRRVFKPWSKRTDFSTPPLSSNEDDPELLLYIPFTGALAIKAISVIGGMDGTCPAKMRAFVNRDDLDFAVVEEMPAVQEWTLQEDHRGMLEYPTHAAKFKGVHGLTLHFPESFGADHSKIHFIGLKGEFTERRREAVEAVYEARPMPEDHKVPGEQGASWGMGT